MKKGIIMEIAETSLTILTPDGQFLRAKKQRDSYVLGEEILFSPILPKKALFLSQLKGKKQLIAAAAALLIIVGTFIPFNNLNNKAYAYMSIDANPSIELGMNKKMQVVELTAFNPDGKRVLSAIGNWKDMNVSDITRLIFTEMKKEGYIKNNQQVIISTVRADATNQKSEEQFTINLQKIKQTIQENDLQLTVIDATKKEMEQAHKLGISTGMFEETVVHPSKKSTPQKQSSKNETGTAKSTNSASGSTTSQSRNQVKVKSSSPSAVTNIHSNVKANTTKHVNTNADTKKQGNGTSQSVHKSQNEKASSKKNNSDKNQPKAANSNAKKSTPAEKKQG